MNNTSKGEMKCCGGLGLFGKCGRGTRKGCNGVHCRCMQKDCTNMHYVDCYEHYIHVEYVPSKGDCCSKCRCGIVGNECGECHYPGCSCHSSVESWEKGFDEKWSSEDEDGGFFSNELWNTDPRLIKSFIREQIALTRREVLEEVLGEIDGMKTTEDDREPRGGFGLEFSDGYDHSLATLKARIQDKLK